MPDSSSLPGDAAGHRLPSRAWLVVAMLLVVAFLNYLDRLMLTTMRDSVKEAITMTDTQFGMLTSVFLWVYGVFSPFAGFIADRVSRTKVIIGSLFLWSLTTLLTAQVRTYEQFLATRALMGLGEACYMPAALALISEYHRGPTRSLAVGIHNSGVSLGSALSWMGGSLAQKYTWSFPFNFFGLIGVIYSFLLMLGLRDVPKAPVDKQEATSAEKAGFREVVRDFREALRSLFSERGYVLLAIYWGLLPIASWGVVTWMPTYFQQQFHLDQSQAGFSATIYKHASAVLGFVIGGALSDLWSRRSERGRIYLSMAGIGLAAPAILMAATTSQLWLAIVGLCIFGFSRAAADGNTMAILCTVSDSRYRATGFGVMNAFAMGMGGVASLAGGMLKDANVNVSVLFQFSSFVLIGCVMLLYFIRPSTK